MLEPKDQTVAASLPEAKSLATPRRAVPTTLLAALLCLATLIVYSQTLGHGFTHFDDDEYITSNARVQTGLSWSNAVWAFTTLDMSNYHPLAWLSHMADCQIFGLHPAGHHATSIVLHAINAVLLFLLLQKCTGMRWRSLLVAALFALHPLNVETVAWIAERKSILSLFFSLCTIGLYGWYAQSPRLGRYLAVMALFALALLSKPMAVTLPVALLLLGYWPLGRLRTDSGPDESAPVRRRATTLLIEKAPLFLMSAISSVITIFAQRRGGAMDSNVNWPISLRLENAAVSSVLYIRKMFWPSDLACFYPLTRHSLSPWKVSLAVFVLLAISAIVYRFRHRGYLVFGWLLFLVSLLPVSGIIQVGAQSMADRYAYVPLIGLFIACVWELANVFAKLRVPASVQMAASLMLLTAVAVSTFSTEAYWRSDLALFIRAYKLASVPNATIETNLAAALNDEGRTEQALVHFRRAEVIEPNSFSSHYNVGHVLASARDFAGAVKEYQDALRHSTSQTTTARGLFSLGIAYLNLGDNQAAVEALTKVIAIDPTNAHAIGSRGQAFYVQHQYLPASQDFLRAAQISPDPLSFMMAGRSLDAAGDAHQAIQAYQHVLDTDPQDAEARARIGVLEKKLLSK